MCDRGRIAGGRCHIAGGGLPICSGWFAIAVVWLAIAVVGVDILDACLQSQTPVSISKLTALTSVPADSTS